MIRSRGKRIPTMLQLGAYRAARRFVLVALSGIGRGEAWKPLALLWARRRRPAASVQPARPKTRLRPILNCQHFHSHVVTNFGNTTRVRVGSAPSPALIGREVRLLADHRWTNTVTEKPWALPVTEKRLKNDVSFRSVSVPHERPHTRSRSGRYATTPIALPVTSTPVRRSRRQTDERFADHHQSVRRDRPTPISKTLSHVWQHRDEFRGQSRATPQSATEMPDPRGHSVQFQYEPSRELVWRRIPQPTASGEEEDTGQVMTGSRTRAHAQQLNAPELQVVGAMPIERPVAVLADKIDPAMLDRITNNVISQVEKRMRIERERRGL